MKNTLNRLYNGEILSRDQARETLCNITKGGINRAEIASFVTVYLMRSITVDELLGFRNSMLENTPGIHTVTDTIDLCGTGGDGKSTFNISTLSSFVVAAAGIPVAKHGNYGVSSVSGSSDVMKYLGYRFSADHDKVKRELEDCSISFLHAPLFHPSLKAVSAIRAELGIKTFFNMLGPLVNPAFPRYRYTGVFSLDLARLYHYLLQQSGEQYCIIHGHDGYDEVSLTAAFRMYSNDHSADIEPADLGFERIAPHALSGGTSVEDAADIFTAILEGKAHADQMNVVAVNAGLAIHTVRPEQNLPGCILLAQELLVSGKALNNFKKLIHSQ